MTKTWLHAPAGIRVQLHCGVTAWPEATVSSFLQDYWNNNRVKTRRVKLIFQLSSRAFNYSPTFGFVSTGRYRRQTMLFPLFHLVPLFSTPEFGK